VTQTSGDRDRRLGELYRHAAAASPAPALDRRLLAEAERAAGRRRRRRWLLPLASAAVVLIGLSLTLRVYELQPAKDPDAGETSGPPAGKAPAPGADPGTPPRSQQEATAGDPARQPAESEAVGDPRTRLGVQSPEPRSQPPAPGNSGSKGAPAFPDASMLERSASEPEPQVGEPSAWIARIRALRDAGRIEEAKASLTALRHTYPDYPVPPDLTPLDGLSYP
jgi:hypothetical protein